MNRTITMSMVGLLALGLMSSCKKSGVSKYEGLEPELREDYTEPVFGIDMEMVYVPGGAFLMGATKDQGEDFHTDEKPVRTIRLNGFHIGKYEVTQAQWRAVMGTEPSYFKGDNLPVEQVSWHEAQAFCLKLSEATGRQYALPTEAQWEYAARGGQDATPTMFAGSNDLNEVSWYWINSNETHPVGLKKPNELGIYDMSGNVKEWCADWYRPYNTKDTENPQGEASGTGRVYRGGSWLSGSIHCRVACRRSSLPGGRNYLLGFRVVALP